jgi:hypothetical protein
MTQYGLFEGCIIHTKDIEINGSVPKTTFSIIIDNHVYEDNVFKLHDRKNKIEKIDG